MFVVIRKSSVILMACIMLVFGYAVSLWVGGDELEAVVATFAAPTSGRIIVIDAGHGALC